MAFYERPVSQRLKGIEDASKIPISPLTQINGGNQPQGSNSVQARWLSSSVLPQRLVQHRCGLAYAACTLSLSLGLGLGPVGNGKGTPIYTWMNSACAELHLFSILHGIPREMKMQRFERPPQGIATKDRGIVVYIVLYNYNKDASWSLNVSEVLSLLNAQYVEAKKMLFHWEPFAFSKALMTARDEKVILRVDGHIP
ncbi:hypothetical protein AVEN_69919-1 [Araneus ventricosus]|uniref:Uncharacterized protein n=1 Tax=Araneus ventricosus TaxID=182803 RepID=A0A4Y2SJT9_ARAVE|nr:hypothetical protein AVEN_270761-1 [Araneus ventricosus]GBN88552.1 hypothetical protein AVEN_186347-1 [Araneus ventricosus]GBO09379.1 hypothetical protein AVEN_69919-1 [Araneus ventricosus]